MIIINKPEQISLAGTMNPFVVSAEKDVTFILKYNDTGQVICRHKYTPDKTGRIEFTVDNIIIPLLSFTLDDSDIPYRQNEIVREFVAVLSTEKEQDEVIFKVIRAGVDHIADSVENFLKQNFLTWQPNIKKVTYYTPEFLSYYAVEPTLIKCKAFIPKNGQVIEKTITLAQINAHQAWTIPVQYAVIAGKCSEPEEEGQNECLPAYYDVWAENINGERLTYIQRYQVSGMKSTDEQWILFENSLGGIDTFRAYGNSENTAKHTHNIAQIEQMNIEYRVDTTREFKKNTGMLDVYERKWLLDFFPSMGKYIYTGAALRKIVVTDSDVSYNVRELPSAYSFTYRFADDRPYLNIARRELPVGKIDISIPEMPDFSLAPRLAEMQKMPLSGGALFLAQNPYSEKWGVTTASEMLAFVKRKILEVYSGDGSFGHSHANFSLLKSLESFGDYLMIGARKIAAGFADVAGVANRISPKSDDWKKILRKDIPDTADELITFLSGIALKNDTGIDGEGNATLRKVVAEVLQSEDFSKGLLDGKGFGIYDELGSKVMELDKLLVRQKMIIQELEIRKLSYVGGDQVFSSAGSKVVKVKTLLNGDFRCYILADDGTTRTMNDWRIGDQAKFKTDNIKEGVYKNVSNRYYWRLVVNRGEEWMLGDALRRKIGTISIGAANHITYTLPEDAYFSGKDIDGFSAYAVTVEIEGNKAKKYKTHVLKGFYPKGTGVLIKGEAGKHDVYTYDVPHENIIPDNWLIGTEQNTTLVGNEESYILQYNNGRVYFARVASDSVLSAGKAYFNIRHGIATLSNGVTANVTPKLYNYVDLSNTRGALDITGEDGKTYTCIGYDLSVENDIPLAEDSIVQLGNQIDKERQYAYIIYVSERKRVDYTGINDYDLSSHETEKHSAEGGFIRSDRFVIEGYGGVSAPLVCDRGKWAYGMSCGHYDRVSHNGSLWLCMVEKGKTTTEEPSDSSPLWLKQVEKGEHPIELDIISDRGNIIRNGQGNVVLTAMVTKNGEDITDTFPESAFSWSRDSGNAEYDKEWNNRHKGVGRAITVSAQDIFRKATFECILNS